MITKFWKSQFGQWRGHLVWTRYAPPSLDWDFSEATFYRVVTTWYCTETVANVYNCFVQLEGDPFSKEKVNELFRQAYDLYVEPILSIDTVKSPLIKDSIFGETCWPLSVCEKYTFEGFRDASLAFAAYYVQHRIELMQTSFSPDVTTLEKSHVGKKYSIFTRMTGTPPSSSRRCSTSLIAS